MRIAVIGAGLSGLVSSYILAKAGVHVVLYEKEDYLGGHAKTVIFDGLDFDLGFLFFNRVTYPNMVDHLESLGVDMETADISFSVSLDEGVGCEWGSRNGFSSLFSQKKNLFNPYFWQMIRELINFRNDISQYLEHLESNPDIDRTDTLGQFINSNAYSELFQKAYLVPICCSIWSCSLEQVMSFSAFSVLSFLCNHHVLQLFGRPQWLTVRWHSYVKKVREELDRSGCEIRTGCAIQSISTYDGGCTVTGVDSSEENYDGCIMGVHAPDALSILGNQATYEETRILGAFQYSSSDMFLHRDGNLMPRNPTAWSAWNFHGITGNRVCLTYWLNLAQNITETRPFLLTVDPPHTPENTLLKWSKRHPLPSVAALKASVELNGIQGKRGIWFCGAYQLVVTQEERTLVLWQASMIVAHSVLRMSCVLLRNREPMVPSLTEAGARLLVTRFLRNFISTGSLNLLEDGGTVFSFEGTDKKCHLKSVLRVHDPQFYWKIATQFDLGLADAYINGDFSFVDEKDGLLNLIMIFIASNKDMNNSNTRVRRTPLLYTSVIASVKYFFLHLSTKNSLTQARRNISRHYDLSNDLFSLFLDETMTYSCAIFEGENEDLKDAQLRKISLLIEKAKVSREHEVLDIGCGWGSLAIEVVRRTGCKYTGITLSQEQLEYAEIKVREAGLQDNIRFLLRDYRQLSDTHKYDRIISCGMIEHVGHEFIEDFFSSCDSVLAEDGLLVLQFISMPDQEYDEYRRNSGFIKEYIFPGGCVPSLSRLTTAMASASRLCVEHVENIGIHYYQTLRCWRNNFMANKSKILELGFDEKFTRTWEYYFMYCAAGFKTRTIGDYQIVFSRPGNLTAFKNPYESIPSVSGFYIRK